MANTSGVCGPSGPHIGCTGRFASTTVDATVRVRCECPCHGTPPIVAGLADLGRRRARLRRWEGAGRRGGALLLLLWLLPLAGRGPWGFASPHERILNPDAVLRAERGVTW